MSIMHVLSNVMHASTWCSPPAVKYFSNGIVSPGQIKCKPQIARPTAFETRICSVSIDRIELDDIYMTLYPPWQTVADESAKSNTQLVAGAH